MLGQVQEHVRAPQELLYIAQTQDAQVQRKIPAPSSVELGMPGQLPQAMLCFLRRLSLLFVVAHSDEEEYAGSQALEARSEERRVGKEGRDGGGGYGLERKV